MTPKKEKPLKYQIPTLTEQVFLDPISNGSMNTYDASLIHDFTENEKNDLGHLMGCSCIKCQPLRAIRNTGLSPSRL